MAGILAFVCFLVSYFEHVAQLSTSNHWIDSQGLLILGLVFLSIFIAIPATRRLPF